MRISKSELIRRLEPGNKVCWSADHTSVHTPCTVETVYLDGRTAKVTISGPRTGDYEIRLEEDGSIEVFAEYRGEKEDRYGELEWISLVAGENY